MGIGKLKKLIFLSEDLFRSISAKKPILYIGILFVGLRDIGLNLYSENSFASYFIGKSSGILMRNIIIAIAASGLIGAIDVLFYCIPLSDLFRYLKRREKADEPVNFRRPSDLLIKLMKVYILANLIVTPIDALSLYLANNFGLTGNELMVLLTLMLGLVSLVWFFSTIIRGANVLYNFQSLYRLLTVPIVVLWMQLLTGALDYIYRNFIIVFLR